MLPFRSGRAGIASALAAFLLLALLSCVVLAAEKKTPKSDAKSPAPVPSLKKPAKAKAEEGIKDVPIAEGHDAKGLVLPDFDPQGRMRGKLQAGVTRRLDEEHIEFQGVKFTTFIPETEKPNLDISVEKAVFNLKTQVLTSNVRSTVKREDFEAAGDTMRFEMTTRLSTLEGNVKVIVRGKTRTPGEQAK